MTLLFTDLINATPVDSFPFLSAVDMYTSRLQEPEWAQAHPLDNFVSTLEFCLTCFYCQFKKVRKQKGKSSLAVDGKNEVSLGNASRASVSHLGWEKALARAQNFLPIWELIFHHCRPVTFVSVSFPDIYYCQLWKTFSLSWRERCVCRRFRSLVHFTCSSHLF